MPTYEYLCRKCGHRFELFQKMTDRPRRRCPRCRGGVQRLIGPGAGLLFKGQGFHVTDYRSTDYKERAKSEQGGTGGEAPAEKATTSKPETGPAPEKTGPEKQKKDADG